MGEKWGATEVKGDVMPILNIEASKGVRYDAEKLMIGR